MSDETKGQIAYILVASIFMVAPILAVIIFNLVIGG